MFEFFRKYNKFMMWILFLLIIPSFALFGVERFFDASNQTQAVAKVDGQEITRQEWDFRHRNEMDRIRQRMPNIDLAMLDSDAARYATLERMVRERVLGTAAAKSHLTVTEDRLARQFTSDPGLASFRTADGKFDRELFQRATGQTPQQYEAAVRASLATQQVMDGLSNGAFATQAQADATLGSLYARREVQVVRFKPEEFAAKIKPTDAEIEAYYKDHIAQYQAPEEATVQYVVLDLEAVKQQIAINEADVRTYYDQNKDRMGKPEERRASHILITVPAGASADQKKQAKDKAEALLKQVLAKPETFADVARKNSQDPGSAEKGGDLDFVTRGAMVKPFDDAMFSLKKGEIDPKVVETEFGYHIIRVDDIKPGAAPSFAEARANIESDLRSQQAASEFAKAAESFSDMVYQQSDTLQPVADKFKLKLQTAKVGRQAAKDATGALASSNFLSALFAPDSLERKNNTEAIDLGSNQLAAGRVVTYAPARTRSLDEVKAEVQKALIDSRAAQLARQEGEAKLTAWKADAKGANLPAPVLISRADAQSQPAPVVEGALRADEAKLPAWIGVDLGAQGYAVVKVNKGVPREAAAAQVAQGELAQFTQVVAQAEDAAYYNLLKARYKVEILVPRPTAAPVLGG